MIRMEIEFGGGRLHRGPGHCSAPFIPWRIGCAGVAHDIINDRWRTFDSVVYVLQPMIKPSPSIMKVVRRPIGFGKSKFAYFLLKHTVRPRSHDQSLTAARTGA